MLRAWKLWTIGVLFVVGCMSDGGGGGLYGSSGGGGGGEGEGEGAVGDDDSGGEGSGAADDAGTGGEDGGAGCTDLTYENFAAGFFDSFCTRCHNSALSGADRDGALPGLNWDQLDVVRDNLDRIRFRATEVNTMPPSEPRPDEDDRALLAEWIGCGAPSEDD